MSKNIFYTREPFRTSRAEPGGAVADGHLRPSPRQKVLRWLGFRLVTQDSQHDQIKEQMKALVVKSCW